MVGAGKLIQLLFGLDYCTRSSSSACLMIVYVTFGGMLATTWVQIIKAVLLLGRRHLHGRCMVLYAFGFSPEALFAKAVEVHPKKRGDHGARQPGHRSDLGDLARPRADVRHRRAAAYPDALLHRAGRQGRAQVGVLCHRLHRLLLHPDLHHRLRRHRAGLDRPGVSRCQHPGDDQERNRGDQGRIEHGGDPSRQRRRRQRLPRLHLGGGVRHHPRGGVGPDARRRLGDQP